MNLVDSLQTYFGYESFRQGQEELITAILNQRDVLGILPTGGGKSICYQLPALLMPYPTIVISPLISLMKDQVDSLQAYGIPAAYLHTGLSFEESFDILRRFSNNELKLLYVAPERLSYEGFVNQLPNRLSMIAIDEAHCVSQWGHDFRPSYRQIQNFVDQLDHRPVLAAFTATATKLVRDDIVNQLQLNNPQIVVNSFDRPNIQFIVNEPHSKSRELSHYLDQKESIIIYANTRKNVDQIHDRLAGQGYRVAKYHAGLSASQRDQAQNHFIHDQVNIMVATNAFGMGIDKTDVRKVIHYHMPTDLESYYQEAGRAGRDGLPAQAILFFSTQDIITSKRLLETSTDPHTSHRLDAMIQYANTTGCLRQFILNYFNEDFDPPCQNCSSCLDEFQVIDVTTHAQMILSSIVRMKLSFGMTMVTDVLRGASNDRIKKFQFDCLPTYGLLKDKSESYIKDIISRLLAENYLTINEYQGMVLTERAKDLLFNGASLPMKARQYGARSRFRAAASSQPAASDSQLYEILREVRSELAQEEGVPAYIICNNKTLVDMCDKLPTTMVDFLEVDGIGQVKAQKYYEPFTEAIEAYLEKQS